MSDNQYEVLKNSIPAKAGLMYCNVLKYWNILNNSFFHLGHIENELFQMFQNLDAVMIEWPLMLTDYKNR